jgi:lysophospholipase L1-like esterase
VIVCLGASITTMGWPQLTAGLPGNSRRSASCPEAAPSRIGAQYDVGDHQHPNVTGENRLAQAMAEAIARLPL